MSILSTLRNTINTFDALSRAVDVTQNNIANASSPGYVRQSLQFTARPFELGSLPGGVSAGSLQSSRQEYAERNVRQQIERNGDLTQTRELLDSLELVFDVTGKTGVTASMSGLFASFSAWSIKPNDMGARQSVISSLEQAAQTFNTAAAAITRETVAVENITRSTVSEINRLVGVVRDLNVSRRGLASPDPGMEARLYSTLEELSGLVNYTANVEEDGSVSLSLGGQYPLLVGDRQTQVSISYSNPDGATYPTSLPAVHIEAGGVDLTNVVRDGRLSSLVKFRNETAPSLIGGAESVGELNRLAQSFAARVNEISTSGGGPALFTLDAANPTRAASTLAVSLTLSASELVASSSTANDIALSLAGLANSQAAADKLDGLNYTAYFAQIVSRVGSASFENGKAADVQADILAQAKALRASVSGVSLDEEAVKLIEYQRSYEAMARMSTVLNEMTETILTILR
jgi:flagellar hook-associated protein 1 FlgK